MLDTFLGEHEQIPPMYSAVKQGGVPLYRLARRGEEVERAPRKVRIDSFTLLRYEPPEVEVEVACSPGTYVRVLAAEIGSRLGCGAYLQSLCRLRSGPFELAQAAQPEALIAAAEAGELASRSAATGRRARHAGDEAQRRRRASRAQRIGVAAGRTVACARRARGRARSHGGSARDPRSRAGSPAAAAARAPPACSAGSDFGN